jgi:ribonuclease HI
VEDILSTEVAKHAEIFCDGASSGNPGHAGIGVVINLHDGSPPHRISEYIGTATNNVAEYNAFITALEKARSLEIKRIKVFLDSELIVRQINGLYKVKNINLMPLWRRAKEILADFESFTVSHISREMNKEADALSKKAVKERRT